MASKTYGDVLDVHAPLDGELNPDGIILDVEGREADPGKEESRAVDGKQKCRRKSRWEDARPENICINSRVDVQQRIKRIVQPPKHWEEIHLPPSVSPQKREILQKIMFADAVCGTDTPQWRLSRILALL